MSKDADIRAIRALSQLSSRPLSTLDVLLAQNAHDIDVVQLLKEPKELVRPNLYSHLYNVAKLIKANTGVDCISLLKDELESYLNSRFNGLYGIQESKIDATMRVSQVFNAIPRTNNLAHTQLIRSLVGEKVLVADINNNSWVSEKIIGQLAACLSVNEQWLLAGEGPASPFYVRQGDFRKVLTAGCIDPETQAQLTESELYVIKPCIGIMDGYLCLQKNKWVGAFGEFVTLIVIAHLPKSDLEGLIEDASAKHVTVHMMEASGGVWNRYVSGESPLSVLFNDAAITRYKKGDLHE